MPTDLFGRTTSFGLGTDGTFTYVWSERETGYAAAADSEFHVDGTQLVIPTWNHTNNDTWDTYIITGPTPAKTGSASFDLYLPDLPNPTDYLAPAFLHLEWSDVTPFGDYQQVVLGIEQDFNYDNTDPHVVFGPYNGSWDSDWTGRRIDELSVPVELGNWYTAKVSYQVTGSGDLYTVLVGYKLWKTADAEPDEYALVYETNSDWTSFLSNWGDGDDGKPWLMFWYGGEPETYFDNLNFDSTAPDPQLYRTRSIRSIITSPQVRTWTDPFDRTVAAGPGPGYTFVPSTPGIPGSSNVTSNFTDETLTPFSVNGSELVITPAASARVTDYIIDGVRQASTGWAQFDFRTPSSWGTGFSFRLYIGNPDYQHGVAVSSASNGTQWTLQFWSAWTASSVASWTATASTWYTAKVFYDDVGRWWVLLKAQGAADSAAIVSASIDLEATPNYSGGYPFALSDSRLHVLTPASGNEARIDNISWLGQLGFWIDAVIVVPVGQFSFPVNAVIFKSQTGTFTANAYITRGDSFPVNAVIFKTTTGALPVDAVVAPQRFTIDAFITDNGLMRHFRDRDHSGVLLDTDVVLDQDLGPWRAGMTLQEVLQELWVWVEKRLE